MGGGEGAGMFHPRACSCVELSCARLMQASAYELYTVSLVIMNRVAIVIMRTSQQRDTAACAVIADVAIAIVHVHVHT